MPNIISIPNHQSPRCFPLPKVPIPDNLEPPTQSDPPYKPAKAGHKGGRYYYLIITEVLIIIGANHSAN